MVWSAISSALATPAAKVIGSVAGPVLGGVLQNISAKRQAQKQMDFQSQMSDTSYQRAMADMRKSGLNPILAGKLGGASTPGGAMANIANVFGQVPQSLSSAAQMQQTQSNVQLQQTQMAINVQQVSNLKAAENLTQSQILEIAQKLPLIEQQVIVARQQARQMFWSSEREYFKFVTDQVKNAYIEESGITQTAAKGGELTKGILDAVEEATMNMLEHYRNQKTTDYSKAREMFNKR